VGTGSNTANARQGEQLKLSVFMIGDSNYHLGGWRHPEAVADAGANISRWLEFARLLEDARFDMLFLADSAGVIGFDDKKSLAGTAKLERFEPFTLLSALSVVTTHLGLVATGTTTYTDPYNLARVVASLDLMSGGRAGWNVVTGGVPEDARQFGLDRIVPAEERYKRGEEFVDVVMALWASIEPDAFRRDKISGVYCDVGKLHAIDHFGQYYSVRGPLSVQPSPQGRPIIVQAGQSEEGRALASRVADVVFSSGATLHAGKAFYSDIKRRALEWGRDPSGVKVLPGVTVTVASTDEEAEAKERELFELIDIDVALRHLSLYLGDADLSKYKLDDPAPEFAANAARKGSAESFNAISRNGGLTLRQLAQRSASSRLHLSVKGTPEKIADTLETWFRENAADGFNLLPNMVPGSIVDFIDLVLPELRRRNLFRDHYEGQTLRENLGLSLFDRSGPVRAR
jgi:N-acetyl-S-(2-succino)cysteine monooxygenase